VSRGFTNIGLFIAQTRDELVDFCDDAILIYVPLRIYIYILVYLTLRKPIFFYNNIIAKYYVRILSVFIVSIN